MMIFFDIDETLVDQRRAEAVAIAELLRLFGDELPIGSTVEGLCHRWRELREKHARTFFRGETSFHEQRRQRVRELFNGHASGLDDREVDRRVEIYVEQYRASWSLFSDVAPCLERLKGHVLGVISNGSTHQQRHKLLHTGIDHFFSSVFVSEEIGAAKPDPEIFAAACRLAGCDPGQCVYIGDRLHSDALSSSAAGLRGIWLNREGQSSSVQPEVIHSLKELPALLTGGYGVRGDSQPVGPSLARAQVL